LIIWSRAGTPLTYHYTLGFTVDGILLATLVVQMLQFHRSRGWRWLEHPAVRYIGVISYAMYLYHAWGLAVGHHARALPAAAQLALGIAATVLAATGSYYVIERPFLALKRRFEHRGVAAGSPAGEGAASVPVQGTARAAT
jgi:peptidoglycan/LPS O-acetylase OafA/YrhL